MRKYGSSSIRRGRPVGLIRATLVVVVLATCLAIAAAPPAAAEVVPPYPDCIPGTNPGTAVVPPGFPPGTQCLSTNDGGATLGPRLATVDWGGSVTFTYSAPDTAGPTPNSVQWSLPSTRVIVTAGCVASSLTCTLRFVPGGTWGGLGTNSWHTVGAFSSHRAAAFAGVWVTPSMYQVHVMANRPDGSPVTGVTTGGGVAVRAGTTPNLSECLYVAFGEYFAAGTNPSIDHPWWPTDGVPACVNARFINQNNPTIQPDWAFGLPAGQWDIYLWEASGPPVPNGPARQVTPYTVPRVTVGDTDQFVAARLETRPNVSVGVEVLGTQPVALNQVRDVRVTLTASTADAGYTDVALDPADIGLAVANPAIAELASGPDPAPFPGGFRMFSGQSRVFTYQVRALGEGTTNLVAKINTTTDQGVVSTKSGQASFEAKVVREIQLQNLQVNPSSPSNGDPFTITGTLVNVGNVAVTNIALTSELDATVAGGADLNTPQPSTIASLAAGASTPVSFAGTLRDDRGATVRMVTNGTAADNGSPVGTNDRIRVGRAPAVLRVEVVAPSAVVVNPVEGGGVAPSDVDVTVRVSNTGSDDIGSVNLFAPAIQVVEGSNPTVLELVGPPPSSFLGTIGPEDPPVVVTFHYRAIATGTVNVRVESVGFDDAGQVDASDQKQIRVTDQPELAIDVTDVPTKAEKGEKVNARVKVTNPSATEAVSAVAFDPPDVTDPTGLTLVAPEGDDVGFELAPGASRTVRFQFKWDETGTSKVRFDVTGTKAGTAVAGTGQADVEVHERSPLRWEMAKRYTGYGTEVKTYADAHPDTWQIDITLEVTGGCGGADVALENVTDASQPVGFNYDVVDQEDCKFTISTFDLEPFDLRATVKRDDAVVSETTERLEPHDLVIVSVGDSMSSGEGAIDPDLGWTFAQCDRSALAGPSLAAQKMEDDGDDSTLDDAHSSVTFLHLACSGANTAAGLLGWFDGTGGQAQLGSPLPPQLYSITPVIGDRKVDALLMTSGINDIKFQDFIMHCFFNTHCGAADFNGVPVGQVMQDRLNKLPAMYSRISDVITNLGIAPENVYMLEYPDPSKDDNGDYCTYGVSSDMIPAFPIEFHVDIAPDEWQFLEANMQLPLNAQGAAAATAHGWNRVGGVMSAFRTHGLCSSAPWSNTIPDSLISQFSLKVPFNYYGGFHPNIPGHVVFGDFIYDAMKHGGVGDSSGAGGSGAAPTMVSEGAQAGDTEVAIDNNTFEPGDVVTIGAGLANQETRRIEDLGSLIFDEPLYFDHGPGELIVRTTDLPAESLANHPPVANDDVISVAPTGPTTIFPLANDTDEDGDQFFIRSLGGNYFEPVPGGVAVIWNRPGTSCAPDEITYGIIDERGATAEDGHVQLVPDCAPLGVTLSDANASEGSFGTFTATVTHEVGATTISWDTDNDGAFDDATGATAGVAAPDGPASLPVAVRVTDSRGVPATASAVLHVTNLAPTGTLVAPATAVAGVPFSLSVTGVSDVPGDPVTIDFRCAPGATYGSTAACTVNQPGDVVVGARLRDGDGGETELARTVTVLPPPPDTVLGSGPAAGSWSTSRSATFSFSSVPSGATFDCALDGQPAGSCNSPLTISALGDGQHMLVVTAKGLGGPDPTPASRTWRVDATAPTVVVTAPASGAVFTVGQAVTPAVTCTDANLASCTNSGVNTSTAGTRSFTATGTDAAGNSTTVTVAYEVRAVSTNSAPAFVLGPNATIPVGATFLRVVNFVDADGGPWRVSVDYGTGQGWQPEIQLLKTFILQRTYATAGTRTVQVRVCDATLCTTHQLTVAVAKGVVAKPIVPVAQCADKVLAVRVGVWTYTNPNDWIVTIPGGSRNRFSPNPQDRGQTTTFWPGSWPGALTAQPATASLSWTLDGATATMSSTTRHC